MKSTISPAFDTNGPLRGYKRDLTEGGIRVPFIALWPGQIPAGQTSSEVIAFINGIFDVKLRGTSGFFTSQFLKMIAGGHIC